MDKFFYLNRSDRNLFGCTKTVLESTYKVKRQKRTRKKDWRGRFRTLWFLPCSLACILLEKISKPRLGSGGYSNKVAKKRSQIRRPFLNTYHTQYDMRLGDTNPSRLLIFTLLSRWPLPISFAQAFKKSKNYLFRLGDCRKKSEGSQDCSRI